MSSAKSGPPFGSAEGASDGHAGAETVAALVARGAYPEAAALAARSGDLRRAIQLYERVWRFAEAVPLAERLGDIPLAVRLALDARDPARALALADTIPSDARDALLAVAEVLGKRGHPTEAASLCERGCAFARAAALYERAGAPLSAARNLERAGSWQEAGRLYESVAATAVREGDAETAAQAQLGAGRLLGRLGRPRDAARALQAAARHPSTETAARRRLCVELAALGLPHAAQDIADRLHARDPALPESAVAFAELELQVAEGGAPAPEPLQRFAGLRLLGAGALGRVYAAEDRLLGQTVALKVLSAGAVTTGGPERQSFRRFLREAEASSRLHHPHIVRLLDVDERAGLLVLEYVPGGTLAATLAREGRLGAAAARRLALDLLAALAAAHEAGIVHRDVKPANVFFDAAGNAKLADFGAAHLADFGTTQTAGFIGTLGYLSPEQITGAPIEFAADLYALGVTLFEALTGRRPFLGPDIVAQHLAEAPPRASELCPGLAPVHDDVLLRALAKAPPDRFASAVAMAEAVRAWPEEDGRLPLTSAPPAAPVATTAAEPAPRLLLGRTKRGQLFEATDPRTGRRVLVEELDDALDENGWRRLGALARAGGPHVQRILAVAADGRSIVYEAPEGRPAPLGALSPSEAAVLAEGGEGLAIAREVELSSSTPVVCTEGGPVVMLVVARPDTAYDPAP